MYFDGPRRNIEVRSSIGGVEAPHSRLSGWANRVKRSEAESDDDGRRDEVGMSHKLNGMMNQPYEWRRRSRSEVRSRNDVERGDEAG